MYRVLLKSRLDTFFRARRTNSPTDETTRGLRTARTTLRERIVKFREQQEQCMPALDDALVVEEVDGDEFPGGDEDEPPDGSGENPTHEYGLPREGAEMESLALPSDLSAEAFSLVKCADLGVAELQIRVGLAYDLIAALKEAIGRKSATVVSKRKHARGQKDNIHANNQITVVHTQIQRLAAQYNDNFACMNALSTLLRTHAITASIPKSLKLINTKTDLGAHQGDAVPKSTSNPGGFNLQANRNLGDHKTVGSWIFHVTPPGGEAEQEEWEKEGASLPRLYYATGDLHVRCSPTCAMVPISRQLDAH